jgi:hypothetical protein
MRPLIYCPSIRQNFFNELAKRVKPAKCMKIDGRKSKCFSALLNGIISNCRTDIVVIANDKARPTFWDYQRLLDILQKGYGMVGLYRLGFFGLHKSVVERIGFFDERFITAGFEDNDYYIRLKLGNVASYIREEIEYVANIPTAWNHKPAYEFFQKKYTVNPRGHVIIKHLPEVPLNYPLTVESHPVIAEWEKSVLGPIPLISYNRRFDKMLMGCQIVDDSQKLLDHSGNGLAE